MKNSIALFCGTLFGAGLAVSGMTDTAKVLGFLDVFGAWDPALLFVMTAAVITTLIGFHFVLKQSAPKYSETFYMSLNKTIDLRLIAGAVIFGIGWGLYGYCPGPAISALVYLNIETLVFIIAMVAGMAASNILFITK